jgi:hypothetical protein
VRLPGHSLLGMKRLRSGSPRPSFLAVRFAIPPRSLLPTCFASLRRSLLLVCLAIPRHSLLLMCFASSRRSLLPICFAVPHRSLLPMCFASLRRSLLPVCFAIPRHSLLPMCFASPRRPLLPMCFAILHRSLAPAAQRNKKNSSAQKKQQKKYGQKSLPGRHLKTLLQKFVPFNAFAPRTPNFNVACSKAGCEWLKKTLLFSTGVRNDGSTLRLGGEGGTNNKKNKNKKGVFLNGAPDPENRPFFCCFARFVSFSVSLSFNVSWFFSFFFFVFVPLFVFLLLFRFCPHSSLSPSVLRSLFL